MLHNHNWEDILKFLIKHGFTPSTKSASHIKLFDSNNHIVSLPRHKKVKPGTLNRMLKMAEIPRDVFEREMGN